MAEDKIDTDLLRKYINSGGFTNEFQVDSVFSALRESEAISDIIENKKSRIITKFLETIEGRLLISSVVDSMKKDMMKIICLSVDGFDKNVNDIKEASLKINVAYEFLIWVLKLLARAEEEKKKK